MVRFFLILGLILIPTISIASQTDVCDEFRPNDTDSTSETFYYLLSKVPVGDAQKLDSFAKCAAELPLAGSDEIMQLAHQLAELEPKALVSRLNVWKAGENGAWWEGDAADGKLNINVCWKKEDESLSWERLVVRYAAYSTWERHSRISFFGWQKCETDHKGISIDFTTDVSNSSVGVKSVLQMPSMNLTNPFKIDGLAIFVKCRDEKYRLNCLWSTTVHEFGHALAFEHELAREEAPEADSYFCYSDLDAKNLIRRPQQIADTLGTTFDEDSIMNYCSNFTTQRLQLSVCDMFAVQYLYKPPTTSTHDFDQEMLERYCKVKES